MIRHLFKLIWNRKKLNLLMISGIFISFLALFLVFSSIGYAAFNFLKPIGYAYEDVWYVSLDWKNQSAESIQKTLTQIENILLAEEKIENIALSRNYLFQPMVYSSANYYYNGKILKCFAGLAGEGFFDVLGVELIEGRWFNEGDRARQRTPIVINSDFKDKFSPGENAVGKILTNKNEDEEYEIIGVIGEFRRSGELAGSESVVFKRLSFHNEKDLEVVAAEFWTRWLFKVKPGTSIRFEEQLMNTLQNAAKGWTIKIDTLEKARIRSLKTTLVFPIVIAIVCAFLIINVALGLFGVIWYNINRRKSEIGLRRALGADTKLIYFQIIGETLMLATFGSVLGCLIALQFPILDVIGFVDDKVYYFALGASLLGIYIISTICALYPGWLATKIQPAEALHNE